MWLQDGGDGRRRLRKTRSDASLSDDADARPTRRRSSRNAATDVAATKDAVTKDTTTADAEKERIIEGNVCLFRT